MVLCHRLDHFLSGPWPACVHFKRLRLRKKKIETTPLDIWTDELYLCGMWHKTSTRREQVRCWRSVVGWQEEDD